MKRPMIYWVGLFVLGELICLTMSRVFISCCLIGMLGFMIGIPFFFRKNKYFKNKSQKTLWYFGICFFVMGIICMYGLSEDVKLLQSCTKGEDTEVCYAGTVIDVNRTEYTTYYIVKLKHIKNSRGIFSLNKNIKLTFREDTDILPGDMIKGNGRAVMFDRATNPGGFDEEQYQFSNGVYLEIVDGVLNERCQSCPDIRGTLYLFRLKLEEIYKNLMSPQNASLAIAMVLGNKGDLDRDVKEMYQKNGIAHLIAISGLHIAMIGQTIYMMLRRLFGGYRIPVAMGVTFIVMYGIMTGCSGATIRAVIMLGISLLADLSGRKYDILSAIGIALLFMLIRNPYQITQTGFLLSFGAMLGISVVYPVWFILFPRMPKILEGFFVSVSVQAVTIPVMLYFFYETAVYGIFLNMIVVPLMSILLACMILGGLTGLFSSFVGSIFIVPANGILKLYEALCRIMEKIPGNTYCMGRPETGWVVLYYVVLVLFLVCSYNKEKIKFKKMFFVFLTMVYFLCFVIPFLPTDKLTVCVLDVGQGDGIYIKTPHQIHILMDGGSSSNKSVGEYVLLKSMKFYGGNMVDYAFVSHSDSDHYNGITQLLKKDIRIGTLILPGINNPDEAYMELRDLALSKGCKIHYMNKGEEFTIDGIDFYCMNPEKASYEDKNTGSLVILMKYDDFDMLFTGDMDTSVEQEILNDNMIFGNIDVLKVAHHGSNTASSQAFLESISADIGCVSVSDKNTYGHPAKEVMERLYRNIPNIYLTKDDGAITIKTNGKKIWIKGYKWSKDG